MVLTAAQRTAFFENAAQLGIPNATYVQLANNSIESESDLVDFDKASIKQLSKVSV